jgi:hypothetical protein
VWPLVLSGSRRKTFRSESYGSTERQRRQPSELASYIVPVRLSVPVTVQPQTISLVGLIEIGVQGDEPGFGWRQSQCSKTGLDFAALLRRRGKRSTA